MTDIGNLSRRQFFQMAMAGAVVLGTSKAAFAAQQAYAAKIHEVMRLSDHLISCSNSGADVEVPFANLLEFLLDNFKTPVAGTPEYEETQAAMQIVFKTEHLGNGKYISDTANKWTDVPPSIPEEAIIVAVLRDLCINKRVRFVNLHKNENWGRFDKVYGELIRSM